MTTKQQPDHLKNFVSNLLAHLDETGVSQRELAENAGISLKHVNRVLRGHIPQVSLVNVADLAKAAGVPLVVLLRDRRAFSSWMKANLEVMQ